MRFGSQSIDVVSVTEDLSTRDAYNNPAKFRTATTVAGCRVRPLNTDELTTGLGERVTERLKITAPPVPAIVDIRPTDEIVFAGNAYQVSLARPFTDRAGRPFKATLEVYRNLG